MPVRVECTTPGLEENWLEVAEVWTRRESKAFVTLNGPDFVALWQAKVTACHLTRADGNIIADPHQIHEQVDDLDLRLVRFVATAPLEVLAYLVALGEANKRLSFVGGEAVTTKTPPT